MIKFNLVNEDLFTVTHDELETKVDRLIDVVSSIDSTDYSSEIHDGLEDIIVSRILSSRFILENPKYFNNNNLFVRLTTSFKNRTIDVTVGTIIVDNKEQVVNGVLYK